MKNKNFKLYFYGLLGSFVRFIGIILIVTTIILLFIKSFIIASIMGVGGIALIAWGSAMRFDYKRKSGYILYGGGQ